MKRTSQLLIYGGLFITVLGLTLYFSPIKLSENNDYKIDPSIGISLTSHRDKSERVEGYFTVRWGNEEVDFSIKDPYGTIIYDVGTVKSRHDFSLTTEYEGVYTLAFFNRQDTSKTIFLTYQKNVTNGIDFVIVVIGILLLFLGLVGFYQERLKQEKALNEGLNS